MFFADFLMDFPWVWPRRLCPRCPAGDHRSRPRLEEAGVAGRLHSASAKDGWIGSSIWKKYDKHPDHYKIESCLSCGALLLGNLQMLMCAVDIS